ncbi:hypothetical protein LXL04_025964 [Taraxacum kok-saghyz]
MSHSLLLLSLSASPSGSLAADCSVASHSPTFGDRCSCFPSQTSIQRMIQYSCSSIFTGAHILVFLSLISSDSGTGDFTVYRFSDSERLLILHRHIDLFLDFLIQLQHKFWQPNMPQDAITAQFNYNSIQLQQNSITFLSITTNQTGPKRLGEDTNSTSIEEKNLISNNFQFQFEQVIEDFLVDIYQKKKVHEKTFKVYKQKKFKKQDLEKENIKPDEKVRFSWLFLVMNTEYQQMASPWVAFGRHQLYQVSQVLYPNNEVLDELQLIIRTHKRYLEE